MALGCAGYLAATVLSLVGAPWVPRLALPVLGPVLPSPKATQALVLGPGAVRTPLPPSLVAPAPPAISVPAGPGPAGVHAATAVTAPRRPTPESSTVVPTSSSVPAGPRATAPGQTKQATPVPTTVAAPASTPPTTASPAPGRSAGSPGHTRHGA
jgi:hypothetical protein